jgi:hypothetical protein
MKHYVANSAWQQLSILAHNLIRSFQVESSPNGSPGPGSAPTLFRSMRTPPFFSSRLSRLGGRNVLRLTKNPETDTLYGRIAHRRAA